MKALDLNDLDLVSGGLAVRGGIGPSPVFDPTKNLLVHAGATPDAVQTFLDAEALVGVDPFHRPGLSQVPPRGFGAPSGFPQGPSVGALLGYGPNGQPIFGGPNQPPPQGLRPSLPSVPGLPQLPSFPGLPQGLAPGARGGAAPASPLGSPLGSLGSLGSALGQVPSLLGGGKGGAGGGLSLPGLGGLGGLGGAGGAGRGGAPTPPAPVPTSALPEPIAPSPLPTLPVANPYAEPALPAESFGPAPFASSSETYDNGGGFANDGGFGAGEYF
ncbi:MAG: hypothetical protein IPG50_15265 [Myxococcales bacterium]|nr:hypothetical protein [Myxococcales bacterium]